MQHLAAKEPQNSKAKRAIFGLTFIRWPQTRLQMSANVAAGCVTHACVC